MHLIKDNEWNEVWCGIIDTYHVSTYDIDTTDCPGCLDAVVEAGIRAGLRLIVVGRYTNETPV